MCVGKTIYDLSLGGFVPHGLPPTKVDTRVSRVRKDGLDTYTHVTTCVAELVVSWSNKPYLQGSKPC